MIGNNAAAETCHRAFPNRIIRYVDFGDMVPKLPATGLLQNDYDHVQREIVLIVLSGDGNSVQQWLGATTELSGGVCLTRTPPRACGLNCNLDWRPT